MQPDAENWKSRPDRRRRPRVHLHWTIYLWHRTDSHPAQTQTTNISSDGFYCTVRRPFTPGEWIECEIVVPTQGNTHRDFLVLRCRAQVLRVETTGHAEGYGLACRIDDYSVGTIPEAHAGT